MSRTFEIVTPNTHNRLTNVSIFHTEIYPHVRAKFGHGPTVVAKKCHTAHFIFSIIL